MPVGCLWSSGLFDAERYAHPLHIEPFSISRAPVTNAEYLQFVEDGGYSERCREFWCHEGWRWLTRGAGAMNVRDASPTYCSNDSSHHHIGPGIHWMILGQESWRL